MFTSLAERARSQAFDTMLLQAHLAGANGVIGVRYDANEVMQGVTEVLAMARPWWWRSWSSVQSPPGRALTRVRVPGGARARASSHRTAAGPLPTRD
jgi:hypothetical protein